MKKGAEAFRSIGEVASLIGVAPHVLRYWETQFSLLKPMKRPDGRRYYRPEDVRLAAGLCEVLREEGLTIRGARKMLARDRGEAVRARGAMRLGDLMTAEPDPAPADSLPAPHLADTGVAALPEHNDPDPVSEEDFQDMASHGPKSRHRHRRRLSDGNGSLPLFPELDRAADDAAWLAGLVSLSVSLRALPEGDARLPRATPQLAALRDVIATLY
ncbi:MerR family transcriptional regulator [Paracoccus marinaquae]|uniref:MerR family transcriptional regulator n=1 Tax=Paracoccus marinaquae TaxID=2841926 RepID=A0ABS6AL34_9RHOB|nr:MerR family transcriptional regulator [Paracoccus marinaquae]MBU3030369.1 MerR family transcriptional regulator [Paracoccus marinaquae]